MPTAKTVSSTHAWQRLSTFLHSAVERVRGSPCRIRLDDWPPPSRTSVSSPASTDSATRLLEDVRRSSERSESVSIRSPARLPPSEMILGADGLPLSVAAFAITGERTIAMIPPRCRLRFVSSYQVDRHTTTTSHVIKTVHQFCISVTYIEYTVAIAAVTHR